MVVEPGELATVVERITGAPDPGQWSCQKIHDAVPSATIGLWRVQGEGWSVVLKVVGLGTDGHPAWRAGADVGHWYYWRREADAYESGLLTFDGDLRVPRCFLVAERPGRRVALWLEDLAGTIPATAWSMARYRRAAVDLGRAQGSFATTRALPDHPWLSRDWLRAYLSQRDGDMGLLEDPAAWDNELVRRWLAPSLGPAVVTLRAGQEAFLAALDATAPTLCHFDLHPANLFADAAGTVLIDWSFVGLGALGEDAGNLVPDAVLDFHVPAAEVDELFDAVAGGYLDGLRAAGWDGPARTVELALRASIAAKYAWIAPAMLRAAAEGRPSLNRRPIAETFAAWAPVLLFLVRCGHEAMGLLRPA